MIEMRVMGIALDTRSGSPIVVLNDLENRKALPIWIGSAEASSIIRKIENIPSSRPMTHDLFLNLIEAVTFISNATIINFYVPVVFALFLVATITSKNRERVLLKENQVEEITKILNYIHSLLTKDITASDKVYLCSLGMLPKEEREQMIALFCIE